MTRWLASPGFRVALVGALLAAIVLAIWLSRRPEPLPHLGAVPEFHLVDQSGAPFGTAELRGKPFAVVTIFTRCNSLCPKLTNAFARVSSRAARRGADVRLVSVSIDPAFDTPQVLRAYAEAHGADTSRWTFLTGDEAAVKELVVRGLKVSLISRTSPDDVQALLHDQHAVLVDRDLEVRGYYDLTDTHQVDSLIDDLCRLADGEP